jgi:hypothetical protein
MHKLQSFNDWLEQRDPVYHEGMFDTIKKYGKTAAVMGSGLAGLGIGAGINHFMNSPQQQPPAYVQSLNQNNIDQSIKQNQINQSIRQNQNIGNPKPDSEGLTRWKQRIKAHDARMAQQHLRTDKEIPSSSVSSDDAEDYFPPARKRMATKKEPPLYKAAQTNDRNGDGYVDGERYFQNYPNSK